MCNRRRFERQLAWNMSRNFARDGDRSFGENRNRGAEPHDSKHKTTFSKPYLLWNVPTPKFRIICTQQVFITLYLNQQSTRRQHLTPDPRVFFFNRFQLHDVHDSHSAGTSFGISCRQGARKVRFSGSSAAKMAAATSDFNLHHLTPKPRCRPWVVHGIAEGKRDSRKECKKKHGEMSYMRLLVEFCELGLIHQRKKTKKTRYRMCRFTNKFRSTHPKFMDVALPHMFTRQQTQRQQKNIF